MTVRFDSELKKSRHPFYFFTDTFFSNQSSPLYFQDYVRTGCVSQTSSDVLVSGSYDHTVKIWDRRQADSTLQLSHGCPVEAVLMMPSGALLVTAGM